MSVGGTLVSTSAFFPGGKALLSGRKAQCPSFALGYAVISTETLYPLRLLVESVSDSGGEPVFIYFLLTNSLCLQRAK